MSLLLVTTANAVWADEPKLTRAEVAKRCKPAVAFVLAKLERHQRPARLGGHTSQGSAFCIHSSGLFITSAHVVQDSTEIELVLNPAQKDQKVYKATVVRKTEKDDLALLRIDTKAVLLSLSLGDDVGLEELADVVACGYPFGSAMTFESKDYPSITTTAGAISSLRKKDGELELIQLDVSLNPGNSGGPILDMTGKVVGVALGGIKGTQVNFAIPSRRVAAFLSEPEFSFIPPSLRPSDRGKPIRVEARIVSFIPAASTPDVELVVRRDKEAATRHAMKLEKGVYKADVVLFRKPNEELKCALEIAFSDGSVIAVVADRGVKIGAVTHKLSELRTISPKAATAVSRSGERLEGKIRGLDDFSITLGGRQVTLDLSAAEAITSNVFGDEHAIVLEVVARQQGKELGRIARTVLADEANKVYLAELHSFASKPGAWPLSVGHIGDMNSTAIRVKGVEYPKGLGLHANDPPATASYRIAKTASVFRAAVAFADNNDGKVTGPTHFEVYGDGKLLWKSKPIQTRYQTDDCLIDVSGVDELELRAGHKGSGWGAHAVWLDPILVGPDPGAIRRAASRK